MQAIGDEPRADELRLEVRRVVIERVFVLAERGEDATRADPRPGARHVEEALRGGFQRSFFSMARVMPTSSSTSGSTEVGSPG